MTMVLVCFKMDRVPMKMWGSARVKEIFMQGDDKPTLIITMKKPSIEKVELPPKEVTLGDSLEGNPPIAGVSPMEVDEVQQLE